ncbi:MAG TPA: twin-arginine translocation signal domain-containing protein, partial [Burkholderiales bacterium]
MGASELSRREFLKVTAAAGGFALSAGWTQVLAQEKYGSDSMPNGAVDNPLVFVSIAANGIVTITCHRAEMGQGVRTGMPMI